MALDVSSIQNPPPALLGGTRHIPAAADSGAATLAAATGPAVEVPSDLKTAIRDLQRVSEAFNRRLTFSLNEKLGQVVVKVIDNDTDKVVREIPPTELQHVYERIREVIGLLFDKSA
jgi:flagellar protein FlaG